MPKHAIVVDDNANNRDILVALLQEQGFTTSQIDNPKNLVAQLSKLDSVDLIFIDLEMPQMNGFEVLELLRGQKKFANVPTVAYTVHVSEINVARKQGFHSFIGKPLDADAFPQQIQQIMSGKAVWVLP